MFYELDVHTNHSVVIIQEMSLLFSPPHPWPCLAVATSEVKPDRSNLQRRSLKAQETRQTGQVQICLLPRTICFIVFCVCAEQQSVCVLWQTSARTWFTPKSFKLAESKGKDFHFSPALRVTGRGFLLEPIPAVKGQRPAHALDMTTLHCSTIKIGKDKQASFPVVLYVDERLF